MRVKENPFLWTLSDARAERRMSRSWRLTISSMELHPRWKSERGKTPLGVSRKKTAADKMRDSTGSENSKEVNLYDRVVEKVQAEMAA